MSVRHAPRLPTQYGDGRPAWRRRRASRTVCGDQAWRTDLAGDTAKAAIFELALEQSELSPPELAVRFGDERDYIVSEANVYRLLKAHDLITSPAFIVMKAAKSFTDFKISGWGWVYLSTILDDV